LENCEAVGADLIEIPRSSAAGVLLPEVGVGEWELIRKMQ